MRSTKIFAGQNGLRVAAKRGTMIDAILTVISLDIAFFAVLLQPLFAGVAFATRIDHTADARQIAGFKFGHLVAHRRNTANDFMAWHQRILTEAPVVTGLMEIGVTHAAIEDLQRHVIGARGTAFNLEWR